MNYVIEVIAPGGARVAAWNNVPLLDVFRDTPDGQDRIVGLLPASVAQLGPGHRLRATLDGVAVCDAPIVSVSPEWGDLKRLILDKYVYFHELVAVEAHTERGAGNAKVRRAYTNVPIENIVRDLIDRTPGPIHYSVAHSAYPDGAQREYDKFLARKSDANELEIGGIAAGQWVGADRIDLSEAVARDGDTIAGLRVDGVPWPDFRLMMVDTEETSRNSHAIKWHPEIAAWTSEQYNASMYKQEADAAKAFLQALMDGGIDYIELNPHRGADGAYDDRVDVYGRYLGLVYGGGACFNAALVEQGHAEVYLYDEGNYLDPALALKDFYSYTGAHTDSIAACATPLESFDFEGTLFEALALLCYAAGGYVFSVGPDGSVTFREGARPDKVHYVDLHTCAIALTANDATLTNRLRVAGNPAVNGAYVYASRSDSIAAFGERYASCHIYALRTSNDAARVAAGALDDVGYPALAWELEVFEGTTRYAVGQLIEFRGAMLRRLTPACGTEWGGRFADSFTGRVISVRHRLTGRRISTTIALGSPLRSVADPLDYIVRNQPTADSLYAFRLDHEAVGLDMGYHLD